MGAGDGTFDRQQVEQQPEGTLLVTVSSPEDRSAEDFQSNRFLSVTSPKECCECSNYRWAIAAAIVALIIGAILSRVIENLAA